MDLYSEPLVIKTHQLHLAAKVARTVAITLSVLTGICAALWTGILILLNGQPTMGAVYFAASVFGGLSLLIALAIVLTILARRAQQTARDLLADRHDIEALRGATSW